MSFPSHGNNKKRIFRWPGIFTVQHHVDGGGVSPQGPVTGNLLFVSRRVITGGRIESLAIHPGVGRMVRESCTTRRW